MQFPTKEQNFEKVKVDEWLPGIIEKVEYDHEYEFKFTDQKTKETKIEKGTAVRFILNLEGYQYPKKSRWMKFSNSDRSNLYLKWLSPLVLGCKKYINMDIESFTGFPIKVMFSESTDNGKTYQNIEAVRPLKEKLDPESKPRVQVVSSKDIEEGQEEGQIPF